MKKNIPFIIGLGQKASEYKLFSKYLRVVQPDWNNGSLSKLKLGRPKTIISFSLGGMIACMHAEKYEVETLIVCSLTPGEETLEKIKADKIIFLVGEKEKWVLKDLRRVIKTFKGKKELVVIPNADHKITGNYQKKLLEIIGSIS